MIRVLFRVQYLLLIVLLLAFSGCSGAGGSVKLDPRDVTEGRELYEDNGCGACHGPEGQGDGPLAKTLTITPRNLRDASSFVNGYGVLQISRTIKLGLQGGQSMPAYDHLTDNERKLLAEFVMSLRENSKSNSVKESN